jgi:hypothetical protein
VRPASMIFLIGIKRPKHRSTHGLRRNDASKFPQKFQQVWYTTGEVFSVKGQEVGGAVDLHRDNQPRMVHLHASDRMTDEEPSPFLITAVRLELGRIELLTL